MTRDGRYLLREATPWGPIVTSWEQRGDDVVLVDGPTEVQVPTSRRLFGFRRTVRCCSCGSVFRLRRGRRVAHTHTVQRDSNGTYSATPVWIEA